MLPSIRSTGYYNKPLKHQWYIRNEKELHYKVINLIRTHFTDLIIIPGLGEHQTTTPLRSDAYNKGYQGGQPDILILNSTNLYKGLAIELKNPDGSGVVSEKQKNYLNRLKTECNYKILVSHDYDEIFIEIFNYSKDIVVYCPDTHKQLKNINSLERYREKMNLMSLIDE